MAKEVSASMRFQCVSPGNVITLWQEVGGLLVGAGALGVAGRLLIVDLQGNFQAAVGVQTLGTDIEVAATPLQPSVNVSGTSGLGMKNTISKNFFSFDPTNASNGDITKFFRFRVGVLFGTHTTNTVSRGEVLLEYTVRYA